MLKIYYETIWEWFNDLVWPIHYELTPSYVLIYLFEN
jgi:hypothetical protein